MRSSFLSHHASGHPEGSPEVVTLPQRFLASPRSVGVTRVGRIPRRRRKDGTRVSPTEGLSSRLVDRSKGPFPVRLTILSEPPLTGSDTGERRGPVSVLDLS